MVKNIDIARGFSMLCLDKQLSISQFNGIYDTVVPKDHFLRKLNETVDFSFANRLMAKCYCLTNGRPAYEPEIMLKLLFLEMYYDLSDREMVKRAQTDMAIKMFLGLNPEDKIPDDTLLVKFRTCRIDEGMLDEFLGETVRQAVQKGVVKSRSIIVDATHSKSKHSPKIPSQILRDMTKELRKEIYKTQGELHSFFPEKPEIEDDVFEQIDYAKALCDALENIEFESPKAEKQHRKIKEMLNNPNLINLQNEHDEDAKTGHKSEDDTFFGFKNHIAVTEEGIVTAATVTNGTSPDGDQLPALIEKSQQNGIDVDATIGDKAYSISKNLEYGEENGIEIISKLKKNVGAKEFQSEYVHFNKDADTYECVCGFLAQCHKPQKKKNGSEQTEYSFSVSECGNCPHRSKCVTNKSDKYKRIWHRTSNPIFARQREKEQTETFKQKLKIRWKIEQKNAHLKNNHGLGIQRGTGLSSMKTQCFLCLIVNNLAKIARVCDAMA